MLSIVDDILSFSRSIVSVMFVLLIGGVVAYVSIPKEAQPDIDIPILYVSATLPGVSPEDAQRLLVRPLERELRNLDGLKDIQSVASEGHASILLEFDLEFDKDDSLNDTLTIVDRLKATLPQDVTTRIIEINLSQTPSIVIVLSGDLPQRTLSIHAEELEKSIRELPSVLEANIVGDIPEVVEIIIDRKMLYTYGIDIKQLAGIISANHQYVPAGELENEQGKFNVKIPALIDNHQDLENIVIKGSGDSLVTLGDISKIRRKLSDRESFSHFNNRPAISIEVVKRGGANIIEHNAKVRETVENTIRDWNKAVKVDFTLDMSENILDMLKSLQFAILTAVLLVTLLVIYSLGFVSGVLSGLSILTSFMISFFVIKMMGMSVNMMVMFGMVLSVGILVDSSIVITEYATRKITAGKMPGEAYALSVRNMFWPVISSTGTTLAAFFPMLFWPGIPGEFMSYLPIVVITVLLSSLLTSLVFLPTVASLLDTKVLIYALGICVPILGIHLLTNGYYLLLIPLVMVVIPGFRYLSRNRRYIDHQLFGIHLDSVSDHGEEHIRIANIEDVGSTFMRRYLKILHFLIMRPILSMGSVLALIVTIIFFSVFIKPPGVEFFVSEEPEILILSVSARGNLSIDKVESIISDIENRILQIDDIKSVSATSKVGKGQRSYDQIGRLRIELEDYCCRRKSEEILPDIRQRIDSVPGILTQISSIKNGPVTDKDISLEISGTEYDQVSRAAQRIGRHLREMDGLVDIEESNPSGNLEWVLHVDRKEVGKFGLGIVSIGSLGQLITDGSKISEYRPEDSEDQIEIRARLPDDQRSLQSLDGLYIKTSFGSMPLSHFTDLKLQKEISAIEQRDGRTIMMTMADVEPGLFVADKIQEISEWLDDQEWDEPIRFKFSGSEDEQKESQDFLINAMFIALSLMSIILITQFNSFYQTFLTLLTVVLAATGVMLGMLITGQAFSIIMTGTGIVALAGIIANNAIILIDTYNRMRNKYDYMPLDAVISSCVQRIRPILVTTTTTVLGLTPMALQINFDFFSHEIIIGDIRSVWWVQFSTAVIFGLLFGTLLTLLVIPTLLAAPWVLRGKWTGWVQKLSR